MCILVICLSRLPCGISEYQIFYMALLMGNTFFNSFGPRDPTITLYLLRVLLMNCPLTQRGEASPIINVFFVEFHRVIIATRSQDLILKKRENINTTFMSSKGLYTPKEEWFTSCIHNTKFWIIFEWFYAEKWNIVYKKDIHTHK